MLKLHERMITQNTSFPLLTCPAPLGEDNMYYTYILKSKKNGRLYIGSTNDLERRLEEHNSGRCYSTKNLVPLKIIYYKAFEYEEAARLREKRLKHHGKTLTELKKPWN